MTRRVVSEEEVKAEWERIFGPGGEARTVRWILMTPAAPPEDLEVSEFDEWLEGALGALEREAGALRRRVVEDGEDFATLARRHSKDEQTRSAGGLMRGVFDPDAHPKEAALAIAELSSGEVSKPVRLSMGCGLYQVLKIKHTPLDEVRGELRESLKRERPSAVELSSFVNQLYEDSKR